MSRSTPLRQFSGPSNRTNRRGPKKKVPLVVVCVVKFGKKKKFRLVAFLPSLICAMPAEKNLVVLRIVY